MTDNRYRSPSVQGSLCRGVESALEKGQIPSGQHVSDAYKLRLPRSLERDPTGLLFADVENVWPHKKIIGSSS